MIKCLPSLTTHKKCKQQETPPTHIESAKLSQPKFKTIPVIHKKFQNDKRIVTRLRILGYKHFTKLSAAGDNTASILEYIRKSVGIKHVTSFEFDPYLCDSSYVKPLNQALRKLRQIKKLNTVFRRLDTLNETSILAPNVIRLLRLEKLRLELPRTNNIDDEGVIKLAWMYGHSYNVRRGEHVVVGLDEITDFAHMHFAKYGRKLVRCREIKKVVQKKTFFPQNDDVNEKIFQDQKNIKLPTRVKNVREIDITISVPQGWVSMSTEVDETPLNNMKMISNFRNLVNISFCFSGNPITLETMQVLCELLPQFKYLKRLNLEMRKVSETEIMQFAQTLPSLKTMEQLTFKVIQFPNVSEGSIFYFIGTISKLTNFKKFDIYFRRFPFLTHSSENLFWL